MLISHPWKYKEHCTFYAGKVFCRRPARNFIKKETLTQAFSCEFCEISKNIFFKEDLWTSASGNADICTLSIGYLQKKLIDTAWKVSVFGVFLVRISPHLDWMRRDTPFLFVFSPNAGKYGQEKLRIRTLFTQCNSWF